MTYRRLARKAVKRPKKPPVPKTEYQKKKAAKKLIDHHLDEVMLDEFDGWAQDIEQGQHYNYHGHGPTVLPPLPTLADAYTPLSPVEMHTLIDTLTQFFAEAGYTEVFFGVGSLELELYYPFSADEKRAAIQRRKTQAAQRAQRASRAKIVAAKRKEAIAKKEKADLAKLAKKYPDEIAQLSTQFED